MPANAVMDAFKNLIRHGKHAQAQPAHHKEQDDSQRVHQTADRRHHREQDSRTTHHHAASTAAPVTATTATTTTASQKHHAGGQQYKKEAEMIVQQEKTEEEAKSKMPLYKGLERFKLIEKMGDGAFSNVYKAIDIPTGQKVAVKVVRKYELNASQEGNKHLNPQFKKRPRVTERANILKEVQIMRGINHPNVVKLISFSESEEHYFLVLELMEGGELFHQIVKLTYFSESLSRHVILQVAHGIRHLHEERGVVHRDIKPENLLFDRIPIKPSKTPVHRQYDEEKEDEGEFVPGVGGGGIGRIKIADFGLSKVVWEETTKTPCGTVGYTAPEIVKDERYSKSVDMWALGCVLYTLLCGFPPFYDESINVLTEKVARGYYTFLSPWWDEISHSAKDLITHLLCVDPSQRYTIDEFLAHPWCNEQSAPMPPTPATAVPPKPRDFQDFAGPIDSPLLQSVRKGQGAVRSPGVAQLKEAFDITYAVHRMEEEGARRAPKGAGGRGALGGLNEEDEEESALDTSDDEEVSQPAPSKIPVRTQGQGNEIASGQAGAYDQGSVRRRANPSKASRATGGRGAFELDLGNATLLGRRHNKDDKKMKSPLSQQPFAAPSRDSPYNPGSPMRGVENT